MVKNPFKRAATPKALGQVQCPSGEQDTDKSPDARSLAEPSHRSDTSFIFKTRKLFSSRAKQVARSSAIVCDVDVDDDVDAISFHALESVSSSLDMENDSFLRENLLQANVEIDTCQQRWDEFDRMMSMDVDYCGPSEATSAVRLSDVEENRASSPEASKNQYEAESTGSRPLDADNAVVRGSQTALLAGPTVTVSQSEVPASPAVTVSQTEVPASPAATVRETDVPADPSMAVRQTTLSAGPAATVSQTELPAEVAAVSQTERVDLAVTNDAPAVTCSTPEPANRASLSAPTPVYEVISPRSKGDLPEKVLHFGFVVPATNKFRNVKGIIFRWAQISRSDQNEWMMYVGAKEDKVGVLALSSLSGCTVIDGGCECITRDGSRIMHFFRIYPSPGICKYDSLQFACDTAVQAQEWITALRDASCFSTEKPSATLSISVQEVTLWAEDGKTRKNVHPYVVVKFNRLVSRTNTWYGEDRARFCHSCSFPIEFDDPDYLVELEVRDATGRNRFSSESKLIGVVYIPLDTFEVGEHSMTLKIRDLDLMDRGFLREGTNLGEVHFQYVFEQPLLSLFMPLPRLRLRQQQEIQHLKELEGRTLRNRIAPEQRQFNIFTMRLLENIQSLKAVVKYVDRIVMWMNVYQTAGWLVVVTAYILWFYMYTLHLVVLSLLLLSVYRHPYWRSIPADSRFFRFLSRIRRIQRAQSPLYEESEDTNKSNESSVKSSTNEIALYQHERRLPFGRWGTKWLTFWDPPAWVDCETSKKATAPEAMDSAFRWNVEINEYTDEDGWQYSSAFKTTMWSNTFSIKASSVRRRKYIGTPEESGGCDKTRYSKTASVSRPSLHQAAYMQMLDKILSRLRFQERLWTYWLDYIERRKNLFAGRKSIVSTVMVVLLSVVFLILCIVPAQWLILGYVYLYFYSGYDHGVYYCQIRDKMILELKTAMRPIQPFRVSSWNAMSPMQGVIDTIGLMALRDWLTDEYFQEPLPLRSITQCALLEDLAHLVTQNSLKYHRKRDKRRAWWKISFSAFLDHVGSDLCKFEAGSVTYLKSPEPSLAVE